MIKLWTNELKQKLFLSKNASGYIFLFCTPLFISLPFLRKCLVYNDSLSEFSYIQNKLG